MTQIICRASTCLFWNQGICTSEEIEYEPDIGCLTFEDMSDLELAEAEDDEFGWTDSDAGAWTADALAQAALGRRAERSREVGAETS
jgi:hypothetical protein